MNKVTVKRVTPLGKDPYFLVENKFYLRVFTFRENEHEDSPYNEEANRQAAMALAAKIENGNTDTEEIIYQTPEN